MTWWRKMFPSRHQDLDEELQSHIEMAVRDRIDRDESPEQARAAALREFGNIPLIKDVEAQLASRLWLDRLGIDLHYAWRQMRKNPAFAITAILTLALGIGANTAIFSLVHAILLRQLPFADPSRVLSVENTFSAGLDYDPRSKNYTASFNNAARSFKTIDAATMYSSTGVNAHLGAGSVQRVQATETTAQFLRVLGVTPSLGRGFLPDEDVTGKDHVALISQRLWREAFHADPAALGAHVRINGFDFTIVGVLPAQMDFPAKTDLWTPTVFDEHTFLREGGAFTASVLVRMRPAIALAATRAEFRAHAASISPRSQRATQAAEDAPALIPIAAELTKSIRSSLLMLMVAVSFVLFIACANVAGLLLVRTAERRTEFAVRAALGAARHRLVQQQLVESILIALAGGCFGVLFAFGALQAIFALRPATLLAFPRPVIDPSVLAFTALLAMATGLAFGIVPAWLAGREDPAAALKSGVWRISRHGARLRKLLVAAEIGIAFILLSGAGLLLRSMANIDRVPLGYNVHGLLSLSVSLHGKPYEVSSDPAHSAISNFHTKVLDHLRGQPGVVAAAAISSLPLDTRADMLLPIHSENKQSPPVSAAPRIVSPSYFSSLGHFGAMGIPLIAGRDFSKQDSAASPTVAIVTADLAKQLWGAQDPLGHRITCDYFCKDAPVVVGVIAPNRRFGPRRDGIPEYYLPYAQHDWPTMSFVVRTISDPALLVPSVRRAVAAVDPTQPVYNIATMAQRLEDNQSLIRFELFTLSVFAMLSLLLVSVGLYGVISYTVTQRTREIGLRLALGAQRASILTAILREAAYVALAGIAAGLLFSLLLMRLLTAVLFGVTPRDAATLATAATLFLFVAALASYLPAHRATTINPADTLRLE